MGILSNMYHNKWAVVKLIILVFCYVVIIGSIITKYTRHHVISNWSRYKNNPFIVPIAGLFRRDGVSQGFIEFTVDNFRKLYWTLHKMFFKYLIKPIQYMINIIHDIVKGLAETLNKFRTMAKLIREMFKELVEKTAQRMENSYAALQYYQAKLNDLVHRQKAIFQMIIYFAKGMKLTIDSLANGPIMGMVKFFPMYGILLLVVIAICLLCFFGGPFVAPFTCPICLICFEGDTPIQLSESTTKIKDLRLGDMVERGGRVTTLMKYYIADRKCDVYDYQGVIVSGSHLVFEGNQPVRVKDSKLAVPVDQNPDYLYCVSNQGRRLISRGITFCDFYESRCPIRNTLALQIVLQALNHQNTGDITHLPSKPSAHLYEWGFHQDTPVTMANGQTKLIGQIQIGERVADGGVVYGLIQHDPGDIRMYQYGETIVSGTQAVYHHYVWKRIYQIPGISTRGNITEPIYSLVTDGHLIRVGTNLFTDYLELPETHPVFDKVHSLNQQAVRQECQ